MSAGKRPAQGDIYDILVIGGGINGAGIARDAAGRGLRVAMVEKHDLASATSSASTKLIHGGLRYLEHKEFRLVRESLKEREVLLKLAPHIIRPMRFIMPHNPDMRPFWLIRLGLFLYDYIGGRISLPKSKSHRGAGNELAIPLKQDVRRFFSYSDCWVEDARLVVLNAMDAHEHGALVLTRCECTGVRFDGGVWHVELTFENGVKNVVQTRSLVNAAGPWVDIMRRRMTAAPPGYNVRLVKGSHIIIPRLFDGEHAYILQNDDRRIVFAIPYERKYTLVGTTDVMFDDSPDRVGADMAEVEYLCAAVNRYFKRTITPDHVLWTYSGVRPLADDGNDDVSSVTRDYILHMEEGAPAPVLTVYGGKLTTYRKLGEQAVDMMCEALGHAGKAWTAREILPGGDLQAMSFVDFTKTLRREYTWLSGELLARYARTYGTRMRDLLNGCKRMSDLGAHLGDGIYMAEIVYLMQSEWARTAEDILWRRTKLGLHVSVQTAMAVDEAIDMIYAAQRRAAEEEHHDE